MTRKEEIAELLKQSPSGLLWSESGEPVYVDSTGMARYCSNRYLFLQGDNLYPLPPLLRESREPRPGEVDRHMLEQHNDALKDELEATKKHLDFRIVENSSLRLEVDELNAQHARIAELEAWQKEALPLLQVVADSYGNRGKVQLEPGQTMQAHELIEKAKEPSDEQS